MCWVTKFQWNSCRNWWRFHHISKLNKLTVMAPICPRLYFFMAHQCRTWCPSSIGEGRVFSFLPPREATIRIQQTPEIPGITADEWLSISFHIRVFHSMNLIKPKSEVLHWHIPFLLEVWRNKQHTERKEIYTKRWNNTPREKKTILKNETTHQEKKTYTKKWNNTPREKNLY